ncbi:hypothetical protein JBE04_20400 [Streptomyces sp. PRKS01-29]|nr:hypothetical protein [Streptomyces sabulosicollis]MBI0296755.1 hypothetical protein [Streptomyces sabulosicollis]
MNDRYAMTKAEKTAFRAGRVVGHDNGKREAAAQLEQARRIAVELQQQLDLATELRIPREGGGDITLLKQRQTGLWAIRDDNVRFWVDDDWNRWRDVLDDAYSYPLHEALDTAQQLASGEAA